MALPVRDQMKYWGVAAAVFLAVLWLLGDVILPFVLGMAVAYMLDPVADKLESWGFSRIAATVVITLVAAVLFVLIALLVIPTLINQTTDLVNIAPELINNLQNFLTEKFPTLLDEGSQLRQTLVKIGETIQSKGGELLSGALASAMSLFNVVMLLVLVPVITFYLLMDWDRMVAKIDGLLPRDHAPVIRRLASDIDSTLASFIRGQGTVCLILGTFYAAGLMLVGLKFGLVAGAVAGALTFIPYVGAIVGGLLSIGLALFQFWGEWQWIAAVVAIFAIGQFVEGNILTPNLVGSSIGLHPVWLIFALSAFGTLFGFVGMLIAVPVAAALGVVARFGIDRYQDSRLYRGLSADEEPETEDV
ncbi:MAG: AI-2E family transporter [Rhodobacteraceae bacterium]|uniref:AI-2E family transporter n=1 Tax=Celeribacter sp. HF31 TaxID=2721558 RepID=UPI00142F42A9|nr:AI-2E family transporter [Celeribacter sp. HF31]NIY78187.1 AI-2E family transporter [Celeribacter sp. HF31]NVK46553.1 AI-2E family transporter [Paracoccaceae bacterium]